MKNYDPDHLPPLPSKNDGGEMTTRELADFFQSRGFKCVGTGGGCEAWEKAFGDAGHYVYITDDAALPESPDEMIIGLYDEDGDNYVYFEGDLWAVMDWLENTASDELKKFPGQE